MPIFVGYFTVRVHSMMKYYFLRVNFIFRQPPQQQQKKDKKLIESLLGLLSPFPKCFFFQLEGKNQGFFSPPRVLTTHSYRDRDLNSAVLNVITLSTLFIFPTKHKTMFCEIGSFYATTHSQHNARDNIFINFFQSICNPEKVQVLPDMFRQVKKKYLMMFVAGAFTLI